MVEYPACNPTTTEAPGVVTSPGYPMNYPDNTRCSVLIQAPPGYTVLFTFIDIDIETHIDCLYDWIGLFDGPNDGYPPLGYYCQSAAVLPKLSHSPYMTVIFSSDGSINHRGYQATFDFVQESDGRCNTMLTTAPRVVTSPNYPSDYPVNTKCVYHIQASVGETVELLFLEMNIESHDTCFYDSVIVYDGADDLAPEIGPWGGFCGEVIPNDTLTSTNRYMTIVFSSDSSETAKGFRAVYFFREFSDEHALLNVSSNISADEILDTFCHCDDVCVWFEDCCHGVLPLNNHTRNTTMVTRNLPAFDLWRCTQIWMITNYSKDAMVDYLLVSACPSWWSNDEIRMLCENPDPDVVEVVQVAEAGTDGLPIFYRSSACATCNEITGTNWTLNRYMELWTCSVSDGVFQNSSLGHLHVDGNAEEERPILCGILVEQNGSSPSPRECISPNNIIRSCAANNNSHNDTLLELCQADVGRVHFEGSVYWNEYCLMCNQDDNYSINQTTSLCPRTLTNNQTELIFYLLEKNVTIDNSFVPVAFLPSNLVLGFTCPDGFSNQDGRCIPIPASWPPCVYERWNVTYAYTSTYTKSFCYNMSGTFAHFGIGLNYVGIDIDHNISLIKEIYSLNNSQGFLAVKIRTQYWIDIEFTPQDSCSDFQFDFIEGCAFIPSRGSINVCPFDEFNDDYTLFQPLRSGNLTLVRYNGSYIVPLFYRKRTIYDVNGTSGLYSSRHVLMVCGAIHPFQDCLSRVIQPGTFIITSENNLVFERLIFQPSDYTLQEDGSVKLCWSDDVSFFDFTHAQYLVSKFAFGISSMCLLATVVIYLTFPSLRNIQGLIMIHFLITLTLSQVVIEYGTTYLTTWPALCQTIAILGHFFFLSSFFWTNVLAWNLKCALVDALKSNSNVHGVCRRMYIFYGYAVGIPAIVVLGSVVVHFASADKSGAIFLHYGGTRHCWIYPMSANLVVMLGPMAVCLLMNLILCGWIIFGFRKNMRQASTLRKSNTRQSQMEAIVYLKISALLGFGWSFGFIAANTHHQSLWYIYIVINSLQGVVIFVAFGMNRRVRKLIYDRSRRQSNTSSTRNADNDK
ncbi:uncharacterized protein LOC121422649 [Lytechinus variegatus]|uniref:uncharacterized protein LOC121422649 n=1 Tax=Lytechinus variegatus TaxID=7654 RepID=UPI001BB2B427|nr:uncharacterized protein LOC121422649 [Lytechinus variegatus]